MFSPFMREIVKILYDAKYPYQIQEFDEGVPMVCSVHWYIPAGETEAIPAWSIRDGIYPIPCEISSGALYSISFDSPMDYCELADNLDYIFEHVVEEDRLAGEDVSEC